MKVVFYFRDTFSIWSFMALHNALLVIVWVYGRGTAQRQRRVHICLLNKSVCVWGGVVFEELSGKKR